MLPEYLLKLSFFNIPSLIEDTRRDAEGLLASSRYSQVVICTEGIAKAICLFQSVLAVPRRLIVPAPIGVDDIDELVTRQHVGCSCTQLL